MRVISGKYRGKRLFAPEGSKVRPTTDRIKESIFNILTSLNLLENAHVLDLFCGSGALGIEALSRGAELAVFVDKSPDSIKLTKKNLDFIKADGFEVYNTDYQVALRKLAGRKFDIIFLDPPYGFDAASQMFNNISKSDILAENGTIIFEHSSVNGLPFDESRYIIDTRKMGSTSVSIISKR